MAYDFNSSLFVGLWSFISGW